MSEPVACRACLPALLLTALSWMLVLPASVAPAQPMGDDPWELAAGNPHRDRRPRGTLTIHTLREVERGETAYNGRVVRISNGGSVDPDDLELDRIPFEDDLNFETRTWQLGRLPELLGTIDKDGVLPASAVVHFEWVRDEGRPREIEILVADIDRVQYPATWLDLFADWMRWARPWGAAVQLAVLDDFRDRHSVEIAEDFSSRMREAFHEAVGEAFAAMHESAPDNADVLLALGDFLRERSLLDEELGLYLEAVARGVTDPDGRIALRTGRMYLEVLDLPDRAIATFDRVPILRDEMGIFVGSPEAMQALLLKGRALVESGRHTDAIAHLDEVMGLVDRAVGDPLVAERITGEAVQLDDLQHQAGWLRGRARLRAGRLFDAAQDLTRVPERSGFYSAAQLDLATVRFFEKDYDAVETILGADNDTLPTLAPAIQAARSETDPVETFRGMTDAERRAFDIYASDQPEVSWDPDAARALALLSRTRLAREMETTLGRLEQQRLAASRDAGLLAPIYARDIQPDSRDEVGRYALRAMRHDPTAVEPLLLLAEHFMRQKVEGPDGEMRPDDEMRQYAWMWLDRAATINPVAPVLWYRRAFYAAREQRFDDAVRWLEQALELEPEFVDAHVMLGELHYRHVAALRENRPDGMDDEQWTTARAEGLRLAMASLKNALGVNPDRLDVRLKLGHCYLEQASASMARADLLQADIAFEAGSRPARNGDLQTLWNSVVGDLDKAEELFDIRAFSRPRVLDVLGRSDRPDVVIAAGSEAGVEADMTFRLLMPGVTVTLQVVNEPGTFTSVLRPLRYAEDSSVRRQIEELARGDRVGDPDLPDREPTDPPLVLWPEQTIMARSASGWVAWLRDYVAGARAALRGERYAPGEQLDRAREHFEWVVRYVNAHGDDRFVAHPAYRFALDRYMELYRQTRRVQWVDSFERDQSQDSADRDAIGKGWRIGLPRDDSIWTSTADNRLRIYTPQNSPATGTLTTITHGEEAPTFSGVQADLLVEPETGVPAGLGNGSTGLVVWLVEAPARRLDDSWTTTARLLIRARRIGDGTGGVRQSALGFEYHHATSAAAPDSRGWRPLDLPGDAVVRRRAVRLRVERRLSGEGGRSNRFEYWLVVNETAATRIPLPEDSPLLQPGIDSGRSFQLGLLARAPGGSDDFEVVYDNVRFIREKDPQWVARLSALRGNPERIGQRD